ncbi:unnamed protein product [Cylicocyclus nassatus]|uniref:Uncharacterized protein n=1 Tax=Cylicocyclus nassatus TaxID=53992 RepID=A0AA36GNI7_CYLNA|nr:unnamed protein product [Cylicocyclus nassatus]
MFHAIVEHEYAKLRTISRLRDSADRKEFSLDKRGDVMRVEAPQNQERFREGSPAAGIGHTIPPSPAIPAIPVISAEFL